MVEVNVIMGAGTDLLVVDVVEVNAIMAAGCRHAFAGILFRCKQQSFCSCGSVYTDAVTLDAHVTGIWCGQIGGGVGIYSSFHFLFHTLNPKP